ncbi:unnamed protein product [Phytophthora lilii]|uniref:Unnamed protein product n=1 Tax=Phytophthora lilii TaxID=2077276 RepID=A0A9W6YEB1_9STRA|nr:unnamed protein product [Phytophthora lilii]
MTPVVPDEANVASSKDRKGDTTSYLWHLRLGHIGHGGLDAIVKKGYGTGINMTSVKQWELCDGCALGKQTRVSYCCQESASSSLGIPVNRLPTTFTRGAYDYGTLIMGR